VEIPVPCRRQNRTADRLHALGSAKHSSGASFLGQSPEDDAGLPVSITTDKLGFYRKVIRRLQREGRLSEDMMHRTPKYLNNIIEADHGALKQVIRPARGFQTMKTAHATIRGFEIMRMIRRGHCICREPGTAGEVRFVNKLFGLPA